MISVRRKKLSMQFGLSLAATTASKNVIYGLGQNYTPAQYQLAQAYLPQLG